MYRALRPPGETVNDIQFQRLYILFPAYCFPRLPLTILDRAAASHASLADPCLFHLLRLAEAGTTVAAGWHYPVQLRHGRAFA